MEWPRVVELARRSTVLFNCIDIGAMFDFAVQSLAKELQLPVAVGQSYAWTWCTELYSSEAAHMGSCCQTSTKGQFQVLSDRQKADNLQKLSAWQAQDPTLRTVLNQARMSEYLASDQRMRIAGPS